jgi:tRNA(fMet)-specific endonuclease VapC
VISHLLDTNICVELIRGRSRAVLSRLARHDVGSIGISSITLAELRYGIWRSSNPKKNLETLARFCSPLRIASFDVTAAEIYGQIRYAIERAGKPIGSLDILIAAHAVALNTTLVTNNQREFDRVGGLRVENWTRP